MSPQQYPSSQYPPALLAKLGIINPESVTTKQAAAYLTLVKGVKTSPATLEIYRCQKRYIEFRKVGRRVFYRLQDLDKHAAGIEVNPATEKTSDQGA